MKHALTWKKIFNETPPVGFILRESFPLKWLRIHILPHAKRYAETNIEVNEAQQRYDQVANTVLGDELVTVFIGVYSETNEIPTNNNEWMKQLVFQQVMHINVSDEDEAAPYFLNIYKSKLIRKSSCFNSIVTDVGNETFDGHIVFFNSENGNVYAPYDGGMDLFINNKNKLEQLKIKFKKWTSNRDDGL